MHRMLNTMSSHAVFDQSFKHGCFHNRCSIQRNQDEQLISMGTVPPLATVQMSDLEVPRPDVTPECKAKIGYCQAMTVWMSANVAIIQRLAKLKTTKQSAAADARQDQLSAEVYILVRHFVMSQSPGVTGIRQFLL